MKKPIILIGFFNEAVELCEKAKYDIVGIVDKKKPENSRYVYLGNDSFLLNHANKFHDIPLFLVPDIPVVRKRLYEAYKDKGFRFETVISPNAIISASAQIEEGCMVQDGCNVSANVKLGKCVRLNSMANIMHDSIMGDFSILAPNSVILGRCKVEALSYIGANATVLPGKIVHCSSVVGAGAVVTKDVDEGTIVAGVPARTLDVVCSTN